MRMLVFGGKLTTALAALWAIGASLYIFFSPVSIQGVTSRLLRDSTTIVETFTREQSWYETQGLWGVCVLVLFAGLYLLAVRLAWRRNFAALAILSLIAVALSIVAGFSIGGVYLPAALGLFFAAVLLLLSKLSGSSPGTNTEI